MTVTNADGIPTVRLDPSEMPVGDRFDAWHEATRPMFDTRPLGDPGLASVACTAYHVDDLVLCDVSFSAQVFRRDRPHLASGDNDDLTIQLYTKGAIRGDVHGERLLMAPDRVAFHDFSLPYTGHCEDSANLGIVIPRHLVKAHDHIRARHPMFGWSLNSAKGQMLALAIHALFQQVAAARAEDAPALSAGFVGLVNGLLASEPDAEESARVLDATARAMKAYLRANLNRPGIGADDLCRHFRCSRATVYRLFVSEGGVRNFTVEQRLRKCFVALTEGGPGKAPKVRAIAEAWGFDDAAHFSRRFSRTFGIAPSEVRALHRMAATDSAPESGGAHWQDAARLRRWLEHC
jgi:AraC-like DNA-binding protein